jgi:hypothetical protein
MVFMPRFTARLTMASTMATLAGCSLMLTMKLPSIFSTSAGNSFR